MKEKSQHMDIDALLVNLDREAELLAAQADRTADFQPYQPGVPARFAAPTIPEAFVFRVKSEYDREEFLRFDDAEFISCAYRGLLRRPADENGLTEYLVRLRRGEDKVLILASLMCSAEGRAQNIPVKGMRPYVLGYRVLRRRIIGSILKPLIELGLTRPQLTKKLFSIRAEMNQLVGAAATNYQNITDTTTRQFERVMVELNQDRAHLKNVTEDVQQLRLQLSQTLRDLAEVKGQFNDDQRSRQRLLDSISRAPVVADTEAVPSPSPASSDRLDSFYRAFEDGCRGSEAAIKDLFRVYLPDIEQALARQQNQSPAAPAIVDIGCGRGEWLQLLGEQTLPAIGIDSNAAMVERCLELGLAAQQADGLAYLQSLKDCSVAAITGFHIVEHLPFAALFALFDEAYRVLSPGGVIIFETPNPENILVGSHTFYHDPSHRNPITPTFIQFLANFLGYIDIEIRRLHPYPESANVKGIDPLTERINGHLCGPQDFAILARKP